MLYRFFGVLAGLCLALTTCATAQELPRAVVLYESQRDHLPRSTFDLNLCRLLAHPEASFYATPADRAPLDCDLSHTILAGGGWCWSGIADRSGPHFSEAYMPRITIVPYGEWRIIYANNFLKSFARPDAADLAAAEQALETLPARFLEDIRQPSGRDLFLGNGDAVPLKKRTAQD